MRYLAYDTDAGTRDTTVTAIIDAYTVAGLRRTNTDAVYLSCIPPAPPPGDPNRRNWTNPNDGNPAKPLGPIGLLLQNLFEMSAGMTTDLVIHRHQETPIPLKTVPYNHLQKHAQAIVSIARIRAITDARYETKDLFELEPRLTTAITRKAWNQHKRTRSTTHAARRLLSTTCCLLFPFLLPPLSRLCCRELSENLETVLLAGVVGGHPNPCDDAPPRGDRWRFPRHGWGIFAEPDGRGTNSYASHEPCHFAPAPRCSPEHER